MLKKYVHSLSKALSLLILRSGRKLSIGDGQYYNKRFYINRLSLQKTHEAWLDAAYKAALVAKEGAFIDVGANTGQTLIKLLSLDKRRQYVGFEPQLDCCFYIDQFIKQNNLDTHTLLPIGLSNYTGVTQLLKRRSDADTTASTIEGFRPNEFYKGEQTICVSIGDDIIPKLGLPRVSTIKIDVEGGELEVIDGLKQTLRDNSPFVFFEVLNHFLVATGQRIPSEIIEFREGRCRQIECILRNIGYSIFNILPDCKLMEISQIQPRVSNDLKITDYVAVHDDYRDAFFDKWPGTLLSREAI